MLHRFKETLPRWISSAARLLLERYGGDASRIWGAGANVLDVSGRLAEFDGIGPKKAAMAVEILQRHFGVRLAGAEEGRVAYDVHVRRVFLRSGLAEEDTPEAIAAAAAAAYPDAPGLLDLPAWLIGRETCRPLSPACDVCRLGAVCPRRTWISVEGVGSRSRSSPAAQ
jgi:endonuclease III